MGDSYFLPHPVFCQCPAPADYCTLAPESDVPEGKRKENKKKKKDNTFRRPAILSCMVAEAADTLRYSWILPEYRDEISSENSQGNLPG